jgi:hypothetical protein
LKADRETQCLCFAARTCPSPKDVAELRRLLQTDIRWDYLRSLAIRHGVGALLYSTLTSKCHDQIPADALSVLRDRFAEEEHRNLTLSRVLLTVLEALNAHGLFAIPYKGPALACQVYGSISLRQFADLDLLVHPRDFDRARKLLVAMGYSLVSDRGWEIGLFALESGVRVNIDLHQAITPRRFHVQFDFDDLRGRLENAVLLDTSLPVLSPSDLLLVLSVHASKPGERWSRLKWICDVSELLHHHSERIQWDWVLDTARERDADRMVMLGVNLAHELLDAPIPGVVLVSGAETLAPQGAVPPVPHSVDCFTERRGPRSCQTSQASPRSLFHRPSGTSHSELHDSPCGSTTSRSWSR